jgi:hypothetical protein
LSRKEKYYQDLCAAKAENLELRAELERMQRLVINLISHIEDDCPHSEQEHRQTMVDNLASQVGPNVELERDAPVS